jgi:phosphoglycolate phosphatase-like HAD superfamily hydrolase
MEMVLDYFSLSGFFSPVVTAAHVSWSKPHPESLHLILRHWRMKREEVVFIGDSQVDQSTAEAAGVNFWSFANPYLRGRMYIPDFLTLREFLGNNL